ncbi:tetratricopeptide repeat protein [Pararobbsia silviterrae]|uniref:Methyltransferase domain-containing protein n=1 Tax=Pararobbsia silviterrae TaxID=1792498 RepID=A0A494Y6V6_9BURK|nr:tetratricopeptide repeat protein [Pararobbsia silviterrae]RKP58451.1 methyltransferase domain-containing protein [Pararobbsia silviterrae]
MANETSKQMLRRASDRRFGTRWIVGDGIDIGCGPDPLSKVSDFFPLMRTVRPWDLPDGDAMLMDGVADDSYDFVHSSHCLEHLVDPVTALANWIRICKPGGHVVITVPDEDLYEQGVWPSTFNQDHKWTFTILKPESWSPRSINVVQLLAHFQGEVEILKLEKLDSTFDYRQPRYDQTMYSLAESAIEFVLKKRPREAAFNVEATFAAAIDHHRHGRLVEARDAYVAILEADPIHVASLNNLALICDGESREMLLRRALDVQPDHVDALVNLGEHQRDAGRHAEASALLRRALVLAPHERRAIRALATSLEALGDFNAAIEVLDANRTRFEGAERADVLCALGKYCESANRTDDAIAYLDEALSIDPHHADAHIWRGRQYLKKGDFAQGANGIGWIWRGRYPEIGDQTGRFVDEAGHPIRQDGRTVVLSSDSGLGDTMQFVRYASELQALGARVVVECQPELVRLIANTPGVDEVVPFGQLRDAGDVRVPLHNLIGAFRSTPETVPNTVPYLFPVAAEADAWRARLEQHEGFRVGLCWAGSPLHQRNGSRSVPLDVIASLVGYPGMVCYSLQKGAAEPLPGAIDWTAEFEDFASTAAFVSQLDLVISVDSAVAHLAGGLGKPVWLLNRFDSCWRWMEERIDSPWYPTLTQFRQEKPGDWAPVVRSVAECFAIVAHERAQ